MLTGCRYFQNTSRHCRVSPNFRSAGWYTSVLPEHDWRGPPGFLFQFLFEQGRGIALDQYFLLEVQTGV